MSKVYPSNLTRDQYEFLKESPWQLLLFQSAAANEQIYQAAFERSRQNSQSHKRM